MELINRSHPLGVTLGQVVVDGHHVNTIACEGIEEHWEGCHKCLTFTSSHLGNFALVQSDTTEDLNIVMNHVPFDLVTTCGPLVMVNGLITIYSNEVIGRVGSQFPIEVGSCYYGLCILFETACRVLHNAVSHGHDIIECLLKSFKHILVLLVDLDENRLALIDGSLFHLRLQLFNLILEWLGGSLNVGLYLLGLSTKLVVAQLFYIWIGLFYGLHQWLNQLHITARLVAKQ